LRWLLPALWARPVAAAGDTAAGAVALAGRPYFCPPGALRGGACFAFCSPLAGFFWCAGAAGAGCFSFLFRSLFFIRGPLVGVPLAADLPWHAHPLGPAGP